jgi:surface protein
MNKMFQGCSSLTAIDLSGLDTSKVTNMGGMFRDCVSLSTLDLSGLDTSKVTNMYEMFYNCSSFSTLDLSGFDMSSAGSLGRMLEECENLKILKTPKAMNQEYIYLPNWMYDIEGHRYSRFNKPSGSEILATSRQLAGETTFPVEGVSLDKELSIKRGEASEIKAMVFPETAFNKTVTWSSSDETVATVDRFGIINPLKIGTTNITATTVDGGFTAVCNLIVIAPDVSGVTISRNKLTLKCGEQGTLSATVEPYDAENKAVVWSSSDESVATVDENGTITTLKIGTADIVATTVDGGLTATCNLTVVTPNVTGITLSQEALTVKRGETATLSATVEPFDAENKSVTWNSSDKTVATVNKSGNITTLKVGTTVITATTVDGGFTATCNLTVTAPDVSGVNLSQNEMTLKRGETATLTATVEPYDAENKSVIWSSSDETVAAVDGNGKISTLKIGETAQATATVSPSSPSLL